MTLGKRLRALRGQRRWTLKEVSQKLGFKNHSTYSNWEYDRTEPDLEMILKLCSLYEVTVEYLLGFEENNNTNKTKDDYKNNPDLIDPFIVFDLVEKYSDEEIINQFHHVAEGKSIDEDTIKAHLKYIRFLKSQQN